MAPAKPKRAAPSKAQKKQAPKARLVNHFFPRRPVADLCVHLPPHISEGVFVPASSAKEDQKKEDQKYRNDVSNFYRGVEARLVQLEEELVKMTEDLNPGHVDVIAKASFLEKGKELVAELKSRTGGFAGRERLRKELMNRFPDIWDRWHKYDARSKNPDGSLKLKDDVAMKVKEEELDGNIEPLFPGMPLKMGFMCKTLDVHIMEPLVTLYGHSAFVEHFGKKSEPIATNPLDDGLVESFKGAAVVVPIPPSDDPEDPPAEESPQLTKEKAEEEFLQSEDLFHLARTRKTVDADEVSQVLVKARKSDIWKQSKSLKEYQRLSALAEKNELILAECKKFHDLMQTFCWWLTQHRNRFYLHHWYVLPDKSLHGSNLEPSTVVQSGTSSPLDCPWITYEGGNALCKLHYLVTDLLEFVFNKPNEDLVSSSDVASDAAEVAVAKEDDEEDDDEEDDLWRYNNDDDVVDEEQEEVGEVPGADSQLDFGSIKENVAFFPGIIKSGRGSVHQSLHIDNKDLLFSSFLDAVLAGKHHSLTPLQWMSAGYVIDMPLSKEGGYLRVAVPNPEKKRFEMNWVHIPFGSFVVRNNALFHSGHYGSPGNTRFHAMVFDKGATTKATELGYLSKLCHKGGSSIAAGWKVGWRPGMLGSQKNATTVMNSFTCQDVQTKKARGSRYYANLVGPRPSQFLIAAIANLNPTPPTLMVPLSKKDVRKEGLVLKKGKKEVVPTLVSVPKATSRKRSTTTTAATAATAPAAAAAPASGNRANQINTTKRGKLKHPPPSSK